MKKVIYTISIIATLIVVIPLFMVKTHGTAKNNSIGIMIRVYLHNQNKVINMPLEEYVSGVVAAEMPADFELEALKAQAVAARTYAFGRLLGIYGKKQDHRLAADVCTDSAHCQAWIDKESAQKNWTKSNSEKYWNKIITATSQTRNLIITYNKEIINPLFHSSSGGKTEDISMVWSCNNVPYLKSVDSPGEDLCPLYRSATIISSKEFIDKFKKNKFDLRPKVSPNPDEILKNITITFSECSSGRVKDIKIGNLEMKGTEFRKLFSLRSTKFIIEKENSSHLKITTTGYGHGVGMSQWGANYLAKSGQTYDNIIKHYYSGVTLSTNNK